jgi:DNA-binding NtrC family response regulator
LIERPVALQNICVLLLEDDALISIDTEDMLLSLGVRQVHVAHSLDTAQAILERERVDVAVLDLVIGQHRAEGFAASLAAARIPIVFASGMRDSASLPEALRAVPTVDKPYTSQALHGALARALGRAA